jgi:hypothetical protein
MEITAILRQGTANGAGARADPQFDNIYESGVSASMRDAPLRNFLMETRRTREVRQVSNFQWEVGGFAAPSDTSGRRCHRCFFFLLGHSCRVSKSL